MPWGSFARTVCATMRPARLSDAPCAQVDLDSDTDAAASPIQAVVSKPPTELDPLIGVKVERWWGEAYGWCPGVVSDFRPSSGLHWCAPVTGGDRVTRAHNHSIC